MPAGGSGLTDTELRATPVVVDLGANNDVTVSGVATAANQLPDGHNVTVDNASLAVTGTFWQATQPVSGTVTANLGATDNAVLDVIETNTDFGTVVSGGTETGALRVTIANNSTGLLSVDDNGGSLTVDGTVAVSGTVTVDLGANNDVTVTSGTITANLGATDNAVLDQIELNQDTQTALLTTIDADTGGILTAIQLIDNAISGNEMQVDVITMPTTTVQATNLDIRDLTSASDSVTTVETTYSTSSVTSVAGSASSVQLLASTSGRKGAYFYNDSTAICYLKLGTTASTSSFTVAMAGSSFYELPQPCYTGRIDAIWASATGNIRITEIS
jgi:hypothetical protein